MKLELKAKYFKNTEFADWNQCAIEKAMQEIFPNSFIAEGVFDIIKGDKEYKHDYYSNSDFETDKTKAADHNFDDTVIRTINIPDLRKPRVKKEKHYEKVA